MWNLAFRQTKDLPSAQTETDRCWVFRPPIYKDKSKVHLDGIRH